jgi:hypothetical protein
MLRKISDKMYLIAGLIFLIFSALSFVFVKSSGIFISGVTISLLCVVFNFIFKVKWNAIARDSLIKSCEEIKSFGLNLPLKVLGKLQMVWLVLLVLTFFKPLIVSLVPAIPELVFTMVNNIAFAFFLIGSFYQLLQGNLKGISFTTGIFAVYNIADVIYNFVLQNKVLSTRSMCLFLAFWSIHRIFSIILCEKDPELDKVEKPKKEKKPKKDKQKKSKEDKKIEDENLALAEAFVEKQKEAEENKSE